MTWEIWRLDPHNLRSPGGSGQILEVLEFDDDADAARAKFEELKVEAELYGGAFELRKDGKYIAYFSQTMPIRKEPAD